jgi:hypothetical protein
MFRMQYAIISRMEKKRKTTTIRLSEQDIQAILKIREAYGVASDNQAIILALHLEVKRLQQKGARAEATDT